MLIVIVVLRAFSRCNRNAAMVEDGCGRSLVEGIPDLKDTFPEIDLALTLTNQGWRKYAAWGNTAGWDLESQVLIAAVDAGRRDLSPSWSHFR